VRCGVTPFGGLSSVCDGETLGPFVRLYAVKTESVQIKKKRKSKLIEYLISLF